MEALGYDRDFALVAGGRPGCLPAPGAVVGWQSVELDWDGSTVRMTPGTRLDLGSTAKAWAADQAAAAIAAELGCGVLVSLGGDVAVGHAPPGGFPVRIADVAGGWGDARRVGVDSQPHHGEASTPAPPPVVTVSSGGLATSGVGRRHWALGGQPVHHLVDPSTGLPVDPVWRTVSVAAATCLDANTASTAAMVLGPLAVPWLNDHRLPARLVASDGRVTTVAGWPSDGPMPTCTPTAPMSAPGRP